MKVAEVNFRAVYKKICLLSSEELFQTIDTKEIFEFEPDEKINAFLTYGYINEESRFIFAILGGAKISDGRIKIFPGSYKKSVQIRRAEFEDADINILSDDFKNAFQDKIRIIEDENKVDADKNLIRETKILDTLRHPNFPDDVVVWINDEDNSPEQAWIRCEKISGKLIEGILLHELANKNFKIHTGDKIKFGITEFDKEIIAAMIK